MSLTISPVVQALAAGDFTSIAERFSQAGFLVRQPALGILQLSAPTPSDPTPSLLISVGIHGDETAPIEILAHLLDDIARVPHRLAVNLLVVVGNLDAIAQGRRYIDTDLNRLFGSTRHDAGGAIEAARATTILHSTQAFFAAAGADKWHLDLHTAIRASVYPAFAIVPDVIAAPAQKSLLSWLGSAGFGAVVFNSKPAPTFSSHTATQCGATSCTAEIGRIAPLGSNDPDAFVAIREALRGVLCSGRMTVEEGAPPDVFEVAQELVKHSERFTLCVDRTAPNFAACAAHSVIARDGDVTYRVGDETEYMLFPNPDVELGKRAGLMVVQRR